jgi:hypothetical protein
LICNTPYIPHLSLTLPTIIDSAAAGEHVERLVLLEQMTLSIQKSLVTLKAGELGSSNFLRIKWQLISVGRFRFAD